MNNALMFSSANDAWATPQDYFDYINSFYHFTLDPCALPDTAKCAKFYTPEDNGLIQPWTGERVFVNCPYSKSALWIEKCHQEKYKAQIIVLLVPARTDTLAFHRYIYEQPDTTIKFLKGRLIFGTEDYWKWVWSQKEINGKFNKLYNHYGKKNAAPFPSMLVTFKNPAYC